MRWLVDPYADLGLYRSMAYLLVGLPLGIVEFAVVVTGLSLGLGLTVTLLGIPVLVATLLVVRALASFERMLAVSLLDGPMPRLVPATDASIGFWWHGLRTMVTDRRSWTEILFLVLRLPVGIANFVFVVAIMSLALSAVIMPILVTAGVPTDFGSWEVDTYLETLVFVPISIVYLLTGPRLIQAWATMSSRIATSMLGVVGQRQLKMAIAEVLTRTDRADAFTILDELGIKLGRGPFLGPTRVEATLLALEATGHVRSMRDQPRTEYTLS